MSPSIVIEVTAADEPVDEDHPWTDRRVGAEGRPLVDAVGERHGLVISNVIEHAADSFLRAALRIR